MWELCGIYIKRLLAGINFGNMGGIGNIPLPGGAASAPTQGKPKKSETTAKNPGPTTETPGPTTKPGPTTETAGPAAAQLKKVQGDVDAVGAADSRGVVDKNAAAALLRQDVLDLAKDTKGLGKALAALDENPPNLKTAMDEIKRVVNDQLNRLEQSSQAASQGQTQPQATQNQDKQSKPQVPAPQK